MWEQQSGFKCQTHNHFALSTGCGIVIDFIGNFNLNNQRTDCLAYGTLLNVMGQPGWEGSLGENGYSICMAEYLCCLPESITALIGYVCCAQLLSHVQLFATPWTTAYQAPLSLGILQPRILEWVAMPSSRESVIPQYEIKSFFFKFSNLKRLKHFIIIFFNFAFYYYKYLDSLCLKNNGIQKIMTKDI